MKRTSDPEELRRLTGFAIRGPTPERPWLLPAPYFIAEFDDNGKLVKISFLEGGGAGARVRPPTYGPGGGPPSTQSYIGLNAGKP
jgi:hypothetical protein